MNYILYFEYAVVSLVVINFILDLAAEQRRNKYLDLIDKRSERVATVYHISHYFNTRFEGRC